jgi:hypothetical protein
MNLICKIAVFIFFNVGILFSQNFSKLYELYESKNFDQLKIELDQFNNQFKNSTEIKFFDALFLEDGEQALLIYKSLFDISEGKIKTYLAQKLSDYYYAKGYYITASKYQKYLVEKSPDSKNQTTAEVEKDKFIIQLGAFGLKHNADQLKNMLETQNLFPRIVEREINGKFLYCVWMDGKNNFSQTLKYAESIKQKYQLQYRIIQP